MPLLTEQYPIFQPAMREITAITNAFPAVLTTAFDHNYLTGLVVRLYIPLNCGMIQIDHFKSSITRIDATRFSVDIDTTRFDIFNVPADTTQWPQVVPIGEVNSQLDQATRNVLPDNILP